MEIVISSNKALSFVWKEVTITSYEVRMFEPHLINSHVSHPTIAKIINQLFYVPIGMGMKFKNCAMFGNNMRDT